MKGPGGPKGKGKSAAPAAAQLGFNNLFNLWH
jgi:hypothetical protein